MDPIGTITELSRATWRKSSYSTGSSGSACVEVAHIPGWRKSSYCGDSSGSECIEVGHTKTWRKSSRSGGNGSNCVEVGDAGSAVAMRDSKDPDGPSLLVSPSAWTTFTSKIKSGRPLS